MEGWGHTSGKVAVHRATAVTQGDGVALQDREQRLKQVKYAATVMAQ